MPTRQLQVMCINRRPNRVDPHGHIYAIGGVSAGARWRHAEEEAIRSIEQDALSYFVSVNGRTVWVVVAFHLGHRYLKTQDDAYLPDNLLSLPDGP